MGRNPNIMIVDEDEFFLKRLGAAVGGGDRFACNVKAFSDKKMALKALRGDPPDGLIISEECYDDEVRSIYHGRVSVLGESSSSSTVSRYSGVSVILETLGDVGSLAMRTPGRERGKVSCIFSFCETALRTSYALTKAQAFGREGKVLYIGLDEFPSFTGEDAVSFSDVMYEFRKDMTFKNFNLSERTGKGAGFEYLAPAACMEDLCRRTPEEMERFSEALINECGYNRVIYDMGRIMTRDWNMHLYCDEAEAVCRPTVERQMTALENHLWNAGRTELLERLKKINIPDDLEGYTGELEWEMSSVKWMNWIS